jgi:hypothetical protein
MKFHRPTQTLKGKMGTGTSEASAETCLYPFSKSSRKQLQYVDKSCKEDKLPEIENRKNRKLAA